MLNRGKWFSPRDIRFIRGLNREIMDNVIENVVTLYKVASSTITNIYGETDTSVGKSFYAGIDISTLTERPDMTSESEGFGPDRSQTHVFKFLEIRLQELNFYPEIGDLVLFNDKYFEINNVVQEQLLGGQADKSHSIIVNTHYTDISNLNIVQRIQ